MKLVCLTFWKKMTGVSVTARRRTMSPNVCWSRKTMPYEKTMKAMQEKTPVRRLRRGRELWTM